MREGDKRGQRGEGGVGREEEKSEGEKNKEKES